MTLQPTKYYGIFEQWQKNKKYLLTKNLTPGKTFFHEYTHMIDGVEYREYSPTRSKIAAAIFKKISFLPLKEGITVLYLGAAHGYTASYISDIIGNKGTIYCLDFAPRVVRDLYLVCEERENMIPILADANQPESYQDRIEHVDLIIEDVAQKNQVEILFKNLRYLKPKGHVLFAVKARSINVLKNPTSIYKDVENQLREKLKIIDQKELTPFERDHQFFVCQKK